MKDRWLTLVLLLTLNCLVSSLRSEHYDQITADGKVYYGVTVISSDAVSITVKHSRGLAKIALRDTEPEFQTKYGYNSEAEAAYRDQLEKRREVAAEKAQQAIKTKKVKAATPEIRDSDDADFRLTFGSTPEIKAEVDLRHNYRKWGIGPRDQGTRPSCSIHATVAAIEYVHACKADEGINFSENYLFWATLKVLGKIEDEIDWTGGPEDEDTGFKLSEVILALDTYGIALQEETNDLVLLPPNAKKVKREIDRFGGQNLSFARKPVESLEDIKIDVPDPELIQRCRSRLDINIVEVPGRNSEAFLSNIIAALNAGFPVIVATDWPHYGVLRNSHTLSKQKVRSDYRHAVTLVGYRSPGHSLEGTTFILRNSWGSDWGLAGYGFMKYEFAAKNVYDAYVIRIKDSSKA